MNYIFLASQRQNAYLLHQIPFKIKLSSSQQFVFNLTIFYIIFQLKVEMFVSPGTQLRQQHLPSESTKKDQTYSQYLQLLMKKGLYVNQKLFPSFFQLKNGLEYPGIATIEKIQSGEVLVKVPKQLVLSSLIASQRPQLKQVFTDDFYHVEWAWQDRILNTYLLYIYSLKQQSNVWYHMVTHLSKDIDILGFWSEQDLSKFKDLTVKSAADLDRQSFEEEWQAFQKVQSKFPILQNTIFSKQNYKWIFIHLSSRCFGKTLQYTSMVPFCQFFNHHCTDTHYEIQDCSKIPQKEEQSLSDITSQGSYMSQDYIQIGQFAYDQIQTKNFKWNCKECLNLNTKQKEVIQFLSKNILESLEEKLKWQDFTIMFVPHLIQKCKLIQNEYIAGRKNYQRAYSQLKIIQDSINLYRQHLIRSYKQWRGKDYQYLFPGQNDRNIQKQVQKKQYVDFPQKQTTHYDNFLLKTGKRDKFLPNNQVYFCYGRNSNRTLLLRYGFAIQGNKYQHVWLSFDIVSTLCHFPDTISKLQEKHLSLRRKFKLKLNRLNMDLIVFFRLNSWAFYGLKSVQEIFKVKDHSKEVAILQQIRTALNNKLQQFKGVYNLDDPSLSYHQYFITVYHQQKQKILMRQIDYFSKLIEMNKQMQKGKQKSKVISLLTPKQKFILRHYLNNI